MSDIGVALREAGPLDAKLIAALHMQCFADGLGGAVWSMASIVKILSLPGSYAYLAVTVSEPAALPSAEPLPAGFLLARALAEDPPMGAQKEYLDNEVPRLERIRYAIAGPVLAVGAGLVVGGAVLLRRADRAQRRVTLAPFPGRRQLGVVATGRF